jgi:hypothetical protein
MYSIYCYFYWFSIVCWNSITGTDICFLSFFYVYIVIGKIFFIWYVYILFSMLKVYIYISILWTFVNKCKYLFQYMHCKSIYYTPAPRRGRGVYCFTCPSNIFFVAFFSVTIDGRNLIFGHKRHKCIPYCG